MEVSPSDLSNMAKANPCNREEPKQFCCNCSTATISDFDFAPRKLLLLSISSLAIQATFHESQLLPNLALNCVNGALLCLRERCPLTGALEIFFEGNGDIYR